MTSAPVSSEHAMGAVVGSAVGDALGAPFEFGPEGVSSARFPEPGPGGEMCGGDGWEPGEATDDTQMAVLVAESLLEHDGLDLPEDFRRFQRWAAAGPKDIGLQTEAVLSSGDPWDMAAAPHFRTSQRAAGNGATGVPPCSWGSPLFERSRELGGEAESLGERAAPSAVYFARQGRDATTDAARRPAALTHGDRAGWEGTAVFHELVRVALTGGDPLAAVPDTLRAVHPDHRERYATVLTPGPASGPGLGRSSTNHRRHTGPAADVDAFPRPSDPQEP
ncbi:ADP-ribosylglycohydrolase family protein [Streptomyces chlorus]|uniref:ADP-ribosylglycohydrolase family protein n=1 Tax=Streptomyces chlorus TaxID=887452 RepID=A0ABW1E2E0_9ACTN